MWSFILSIYAQVSSIIAVYFFARAVGIDNVGMVIFLIVVPIVAVMSMLPSLNGLGIRETGFVLLLKGYMPQDKAGAIAILFLASITIFGIIGGMIYASKKSIFAFKKEESR